MCAFGMRGGEGGRSRGGGGWVEGERREEGGEIWGDWWRGLEVLGGATLYMIWSGLGALGWQGRASPLGGTKDIVYIMAWRGVSAVKWLWMRPYSMCQYVVGDGLTNPGRA